MHLNTDASGGEIRATLIDDEGEAVPGFEAALTGERLDGTIAWTNELPAKPVRLKLELRNAKLYSYW